jgi:hypothetical protein
MGVLYAALSELAAKVQQEEIALQLEKVGEPPTSCGIDTLISRYARSCHDSELDK